MSRPTWDRPAATTALSPSFTIKASRTSTIDSYKSAVKNFAEVERQYPYSSWATKSILMQAYANYENGKFDDAINAANRFITLHPGHKDAPYAYYLIALCNYDRIADTKRDQTTTMKALDNLEEIERRFPGTPYAADAEKKVSPPETIWPERKWKSGAITTSRVPGSPASTASSGW